MRYLAFLHPPAGRGNWSANFPDLPGCVATGRTFEDVCASAREALALHLQGMAEDGEAPPAPRGLKEIQGDATVREEIEGAHPVPVGVGERSRRRVRVLLPQRFPIARSVSLPAADRLVLRNGLSHPPCSSSASLPIARRPSWLPVNPCPALQPLPLPRGPPQQPALRPTEEGLCFQVLGIRG